MAKSQARKNAERLFNMFADALYSALPTETIEQVRTRLFRGVTDEDRAALESLITEHRQNYTPKEEREIEAMSTVIEEVPAAE